MTTPDAERLLAERLEALNAEYRGQLPDRLRQIEVQLGVCRRQPSDTAAKDQLRLLLHKLAGSGTSFGYSKLSSVARRWERVLRDEIDNKNILGHSGVDATTLFAELRSAAIQPDHDTPSK